MLDLIDYPSNSLFSTPCNVISGKFLPFIDPNEAKRTTRTCYNPLRKNIVTCQDQFKNEFLDEVNGLALDSKLTSEILDIPSYMPVLDIRSAKLGNIPNDYPIVGVTLSDILRRSVLMKAGRYHERSSISFREDILGEKNFKGRKVILFLTGSDTLIEWIWYNRNECNLFNTIKEMGIWAVGGFNFSLIEGECSFSHALNLKRSLFSSWLTEKAGLLAIPHAYSLNEFHTQRWIEFFKANPKVKLFTVNCQLQKSVGDINQVIAFVNQVLKTIPHLHILLQGFHLNKINCFSGILKRIHFADKIASKYAQSHRKIFFDLEKGLYDKNTIGLNLNELLENNIKARSLFIENMRATV